MSQTHTLARPYARAAFAVAKDEGKFAQWSEALNFAAQVSGNAQVAVLLYNPALTHDQAVALLAPVDASETFARFITILAQAHRLLLLPEIAGMYEQLRAQAEHVVNATVTSAIELPNEELEKLKVSLKKRFGCEVTLSTAVDASLLGGAIIDAGDVVIDGSLKSKLSRLVNVLAN